MTQKSIIFSRVKVQDGSVIIPLKKWQKMEKKLWETQQAMDAILAGERAIREGKIRPFKDFLKEWHAKNK